MFSTDIFFVICEYMTINDQINAKDGLNIKDNYIWKRIKNSKISILQILDYVNKEQYKLEHLLKFENTFALSLWYLIQDKNIKSFHVHYNSNELKFFITQYKGSTLSYFSKLFKKCAESHGYLNIISSYDNNGLFFEINKLYRFCIVLYILLITNISSICCINMFTSE